MCCELHYIYRDNSLQARNRQIREEQDREFDEAAKRDRELGEQREREERLQQEREAAKREVLRQKK